uniref:Thyroid hormone receptor interactor 6 n=1 Tax=Nomascus leucogenys TaxID=61853 RepID=G1RMT9_NOMLE
MSGPTWLPPKQPEPARTSQGRAIPRGTPGPPPAQGAALQPHPRVNFCPLPSEQCYQAPGGPEDRGPAWVGSHGVLQRTQGLPADRGGLRPGSLDAEIDLLSSTLAELNGGRGHAPRRPDRQAEVKSGGLAIGARESQGQGPKRKLLGSLALQEEEEEASTGSR